MAGHQIKKEALRHQQQTEGGSITNWSKPKTQWSNVGGENQPSTPSEYSSGSNAGWPQQPSSGRFHALTSDTVWCSRKWQSKEEPVATVTRVGKQLLSDSYWVTDLSPRRGTLCLRGSKWDAAVTLGLREESALIENWSVDLGSGDWTSRGVLSECLTWRTAKRDFKNQNIFIVGKLSTKQIVLLLTTFSSILFQK